MRLRAGLLLAAVVAVVTGVLALWPAEAAAEDRVTIRGNYYRERSTRVMQPAVAVTVDAPDERFTVGAAYLLDAITSASIATGTSAVTGGDFVFTEIRHEAMGSVSSKLGEWQLGGFFRYSTETDWVSRSIGGSVGRDFLQRSLNFNLAYSYNFDRVFRIINGQGGRLPWCGGALEPNCDGSGSGIGTNLLQSHYLALGYSQALHKTVLIHSSLEGVFSRGPQDNPYRAELIPTVLFETHPLERNRLTWTSGVRWHVPKGRTTFAPIYRFYADDWGILAHSIDLRVHFRVHPNVRLRARYRYYTQSESFFWRDDMNYQESPQRCTRDTIEGCASADPKMSQWLSHTPGLQLTYELDGLAKYRRLRWLEGGYVQATYNHVFQTNRFGNARMGSLALSLAF